MPLSLVAVSSGPPFLSLNAWGGNMVEVHTYAYDLLLLHSTASAASTSLVSVFLTSQDGGYPCRNKHARYSSSTVLLYAARKTGRGRCSIAQFSLKMVYPRAGARARPPLPPPTKLSPCYALLLASPVRLRAGLPYNPRTYIRAVVSDTNDRRSH